LWLPLLLHNTCQRYYAVRTAARLSTAAAAAAAEQLPALLCCAHRQVLKLIRRQTLCIVAHVACEEHARAVLLANHALAVLHHKPGNSSCTQHASTREAFSKQHVDKGHSFHINAA
jgi:hypothetical protein